VNKSLAISILLFGLLFAPSVFCAEQASLPSLTIGTKTYTNVTLKVRNASEAEVRFAGGMKVIKLKDLPEPYRSRWYDPARERKAQEKQAAVRIAKAREQRARETTFRREFLDRSKPLRVIEGKVYDFTFIIQQESTSRWAENYVVRGTAKQARDEGLLVETKNGNLVFLLNAGEREGSSIKCLALPVGQFEYKNKSGATDAIPKYDAGMFFDPAKHQFDTAILLAERGEIPFPLKNSDYLRK